MNYPFSMQRELLARPCGCGVADVDSRGNITKCRSCPLCMRVGKVLDSGGAVQYAHSDVRGSATGKVELLKQEEFFSS